MSTRAAVYLRISQDATGEQAGVSRQREDCLQLVESQGWVVHDVYVDNDISASSGAARPSYRRMLADVSEGSVDAVVAWHPDRLYRKLASLEELINACESRNVTMRTVKAGEIDLSTPTGRMLARILSATAQAEGEMKADRWKRSWRQGREQGLPAKTGTRLFGYTHTSEVVPEEAAITRRMAQHMLEGGTLGSLASQLEAEGVVATRGRHWTHATIKQYLINPRIAGYSTLNREIVGDGNWEPLLDRETWESLRALLTARTAPAQTRVSLLNGLIHCGRCGHRLITGSARGKRAYRCPSRPGMRGCGRMQGMSAPIEEIVEEFAKARLDDPRVRERVAGLRSEPLDAQQEITQLEMRARELEAQLEQPGVPVSTILRAIERTRERQGELMAEAATAPRAPSVTGKNFSWPQDLGRRRALVDLVVERVELNAADSRHSGRFDPRRVVISPR